MESLTLHWGGPIHFYELREEWHTPQARATYCEKLENHGIYQDWGIYMVVGGQNILYIGQTYDQTFYDRLTQHMNDETWWRCARRACSGREPFFKCAYLKEAYSRRRISDIESFLIFVIQPRCNSTGASYDGHTFKLKNTGNFWPLNSTYHTEDYRAFPEWGLRQ